MILSYFFSTNRAASAASQPGQVGEKKIHRSILNSHERRGGEGYQAASMVSKERKR